MKLFAHKNVLFTLSLAVMLVVPTVTFGAYGGLPTPITTPVPTPTATPVVGTGSSSRGGGGGGGGGSAALFYCTPTVSQISPSQNATVSALNGVSFVASSNTNPNDITVSVNGNAIPYSVTRYAGGQYLVESTDVTAGTVKQGGNIVRITAGGSLFGCEVQTSYRVDVTNGLVPTPTPTADATATPAPTPASLLPLATRAPAPLTVANACSKGEVNRDGFHDPNKTYDDSRGHWAEEYILDLTRRCIVHGRELGGESNFEPNEAFNRAEAAKVLVKAFNVYAPAVNNNPFRDVVANTWFAPYVDAARNAGIVTGYGDGSFGPGDSITRVDALAMVARASGSSVVAYSGNTPYSDVPADAWFAPYVAWAVEKGMANGDATVFNPGAIISRAEYAMLVSMSIR